MILGRALLLSRAAIPFVQPRPNVRPNVRPNMTLILLTCKMSTCHITKNIEFLTRDKGVTLPKSGIKKLENPQNRPLLIMLCWLASKRKHTMKFANLYMEQGFDVAMVSVTPFQLLFPAKGSRLVAADILKFLALNENYKKVLLHGFSVGGYVWGEVLTLIETDRQKYTEVVDKVVGQVWDSVADLSELPIGTPRAMFPNNVWVQRILQKYLEYHLKIFYDQSTQYYERSSQLFHENIIHAPALLFISKTDPVGTLTSNMKLRDQWESLGIKTCVKIFEQSPHVGHYHKYPQEYLAELYAFLTKLNFTRPADQTRSRL